MPVAKTYEKLTLQGEPFIENKRMYVYVLAKNGPKKVRWYSDAEYRRMYPQAAVTHNIMDFNGKHVFGFEETNYITLYRGENVEEWANEDRTNIRYNCTFGFFTPGRLQLPHLTEGIEAVQLMWDEVAADEIRMRPHEEVKKIVAAKLGTLSKSEYQGYKDEILKKEVTIREDKINSGYFGEKHTYIMVDSTGNTYIWETSERNLIRGQTISIKMKVKDHKEIKGEKVTVVWYCKVI